MRLNCKNNEDHQNNNNDSKMDLLIVNSFKPSNQIKEEKDEDQEMEMKEEEEIIMKSKYQPSSLPITSSKNSSIHYQPSLHSILLEYSNCSSNEEKEEEMVQNEMMNRRRRDDDEDYEEISPYFTSSPISSIPIYDLELLENKFVFLVSNDPTISLIKLSSSSSQNYSTSTNNIYSFEGHSSHITSISSTISSQSHLTDYHQQQQMNEENILFISSSHDRSVKLWEVGNCENEFISSNQDKNGDESRSRRRRRCWDEMRIKSYNSPLMTISSSSHNLSSQKSSKNNNKDKNRRRRRKDGMREGKGFQSSSNSSSNQVCFSIIV